MFEPIYLRQLIRDNLEWQLEMNTTTRFVRMFVSFNYMHYKWKNCSIAWQFQFINKDRNDFIILKVIIDKCLWFWHVHFGLPSGNNDLNVLNRSQLVSNLLCVQMWTLNFRWMEIATQNIVLLRASIHDGWFLCQLCMNFKVKNSMIGNSA